MGVVQIIALELREVGPLVVHLLLELVIFMAKQKCCRRQYILLPPLGQITKFNPKRQGFKFILELTCK